MNCNQIAEQRANLLKCKRDAWAIVAQTGAIEDLAQARTIEDEANEMLKALDLIEAANRVRKMPRKQGRKAAKRALLKHCTRVDADAPLLPQMRRRV